jgi:predicted amidophosphoribosyltransferase
MKGILMALRGKKEDKLKAPNCPKCGQYMDKIEGWTCSTCGKKTTKK